MSSTALQEAWQAYRAGAFDRALARLDQRLAAAPDDARCHYLRGVVCKDAGREKEAIAAFDRAIELEPSLHRIHYHRGTVRFLAGDRTGAFADLERAVQEEPDFLLAVYNLGVVAAALGRWGDAKEAFRRALVLDPANAAEYVDLLVEIGRAAAQSEFYRHGHRLKNRLAVLGDDLRGWRRASRPAEGEAETAWQERARRIESEVSRLYEDMARWLRAVDMRPPEVRVIRIGQLLDRLLFALSPRLEGIEVVRRVQPRLPDVIGDPEALTEALLNVLINAAEACHEREGQGPARIEIEVDAIDAVSEIPGVDTIRIRVRDTGPGVAERDLPRVFEFGFTTKRFGSGLGLSSTLRVLEAHGGRIELRNREVNDGGGLEVTVYLPASPVGRPKLANLTLRSFLFEDLRPLAIRTGAAEAVVPRRGTPDGDCGGGASR